MKNSWLRSKTVNNKSIWEGWDLHHLPSTTEKDVAFTRLIRKLVVYCLTSRSRIFNLNGDVTIAGEGLQNLGLCLALRAFEQGGILIVPHLLWHGTSVFPVSSKGCLLRHTRGCGWYILIRIVLKKVKKSLLAMGYRAEKFIHCFSIFL
jgi:hypothetical protein